jgi:hypothetical protein
VRSIRWDFNYGDWVKRWKKNTDPLLRQTIPCIISKNSQGEKKMATRPEIRTVIKKSDADVSAQEQPSQRKRPEAGPFRLQVDRQTKGSYLTLEAAEEAGLVIKQGHPIVQVSVYDSTAGINKIIEVSKS